MRKTIIFLMLLAMLLLPGIAAADAASTYYQMISYNATDVSEYQQDLVIHRTTGTAYEETSGGLKIWHLYVGDHCQEDYGDLRFSDRYGRELAYYLWPDYDAESARVCVRLEGADAAGTLAIHYGNPSATTTSDKAATFLFSEEFPSGALDPEKWTEDAVGSITDTRTGDGMNKITGGAVSGSSYWMYDTSDTGNQHHAKVALPASYTIEWENTVSTLSADQMGQGGVGLVSGTSKIVVFAGHVDWRGDTIAAHRVIIHERGSLVRYNGYTQGETAYQTKTAASSETKIPYKIRVANNDVAVTINNQLACTFTKTTAISKLAILVGTYGGYPFVTYIGISNLRVRAYSATPPSATAFSGERASLVASAFTATPTSGTAPLTVQFTDTSLGNVTAWSWAFGDGDASSSQHPSHTYTSPGTYTVSLTVANDAGEDTETKSGYITVADSPAFSVSASPRSGAAPLTVAFSALQTSTTPITSWAWTFGDGNTSTEHNPVHNYTETGTYTVTVTGSHAYGSTQVVRTAYIQVRTDVIIQPNINETRIQSAVNNYDPMNGKYTRYWSNMSGGFPVYGFVFSIVAPFVEFFGYWFFVILWFVYLGCAYLRTGTTTIPLVVGLISGSVWGAVMPPESHLIAYVLLAIAAVGLLMKIYVRDRL